MGVAEKKAREKKARNQARVKARERAKPRAGASVRKSEKGRGPKNDRCDSEGESGAGSREEN